jgi:hypothetical protein
VIAYFERKGTRNAVITLLLLGLMFDIVWDGKAGSGCDKKSAAVSISRH